MANLFKRSGIWYINYRYNGRQYRSSTGTDNEKLAIVKLHELEVELFRGNHQPMADNPKHNLIGSFFRRYIEFSRATKSHATNLSDCYRIRQIQEYFAGRGLKFLEEISPGEIQLFQSFLLSDHNARTYNNFLGLLKAMLNKAAEWEIIESNPIKGCKPLKVAKKVRYFSAEEVHKLREAADPEMKLVIDIAIYAGLRRAEIYYLRWKDIDLEKRVIHVRPHGDFIPKGRKPGTVPINSRLMNVLKRVYPKGTSTELENFVFNRKHKGRPLNPTQVLSNRFRRLAIKAGVKNARLHDCRHTFASTLVQAGIPILVVKELLRHSDIQSTMIYAHLKPDLHRKAVESLVY